MNEFAPRFYSACEFEVMQPKILMEDNSRIWVFLSINKFVVCCCQHTNNYHWLAILFIFRLNHFYKHMDWKSSHARDIRDNGMTDVTNCSLAWLSKISLRFGITECSLNPGLIYLQLLEIPWILGLFIFGFWSSWLTYIKVFISTSYDFYHSHISTNFRFYFFSSFR